MPTDTVLFYAVFVAPGFVAVMTTISLAAIEKEYSVFTLLVWSLVASLMIDTGFIALYQWMHTPITSFEQFTGILFDPHFQVLYVLGILLFSFLVGVTSAICIIADIPGGMRRWLQSISQIQGNLRQPWANFMRDTQSVRIKASDGELYEGLVTEWSRADRPKEVRIRDPYYYDIEAGDYRPLGREDVLFLEKDIDRLMMRTRDNRPSAWTRFVTRLGNFRAVRAVVCGLCDRWRDQQQQE